MTAIEASDRRGDTATPAVRLREDVFDARCAELDIVGEQAKADLVDVDRVTLWRYRRGLLTPNLDVAFRFAQALDLQVNDLFEAVT